MQFVRLLACFLLGSAMILLPACNSSDPDLRGDEEEACQWLTPDLPAGPCGGDAWAVLASWRAAQPALETTYLSFATHADPVRESTLQRQTGFQIPGREDLRRWPLTLPLNWNANPYNDSNWRFQLHAWRMVDPLILACLKSGVETFIAEAVSIVQDWHAYHLTDGSPSAYGWYDMSTGIRAMKLAFLLDRALRRQFELTAEGQRMLVELAEAHARKLMEPDFLSLGNHGLFQLHGLIALCRTVPYLASCAPAVQYAETAMAKILDLQFSAKGIHLEHSPSYHFFVVDTVARMLRSGWYEEFEQTMALMRKAQQNKKWMVHPDMRDVTIGDSEEAERRLRLPPGQKACMDVALFRQDCYLLKAFPSSGYAIVRSDWAIPQSESSMLFFMGAFHSARHKHADDLSFELFEFGERVLTDSGKFSYNRGPFRDYVLSTRAHNTLEINGRSSSLRAADAYGSALKVAKRRGGAIRLEAQAVHQESGVNHRRLLVYAPRQWLVVADRIDGAITSATQWFHFSPQVQVFGPAQDEPPGTPYRARLRSGREIRIEQHASPCRAKLAFGQDNPIQGWSTTAYGAMTPRAALGFSCVGEHRSFVTVLTLDEQHHPQAMAAAAATLREMDLSASPSN